jgi:hypothetical protein
VVDPGLTRLAADLARAAAEAPIKAAAMVEKGALNVKEQAIRNARQTSGVHARHYPDTISYGIDVGGLSAEIGPERRGQGNLGPILENGSINNPPHRTSAAPWTPRSRCSSTRP